MSIEYIRKVWRLPATVGSVKRLVLLAIADNANDDGYAWPSQATLATKTGLSVRSIQVHVSELMAEGLLAIDKVPRRAGRWHRNAYQMQLDHAQKPAHGGNAQEPALSDDDQANDVRPDQAQTDATPGAPRAHGPGAPRAHEPSVVEPSREPPEEEAAPLEVAVLNACLDAIDECLGQVGSVPRSEFDNLRRAIEERDGYHLAITQTCAARKGKVARWWTLKDEINKAWEAGQQDYEDEDDDSPDAAVERARKKFFPDMEPIKHDHR